MARNSQELRRNDAPSKSDTTGESKDEAKDLKTNDFKTIYRKAHSNKDSALALFTDLEKKSPGGALEFARAITDLSIGSLTKMIRHGAGKDELLKEALCRTVEAQRKEITGENPSPLEALLADRVVVSLLQIADR